MCGLPCFLALDLSLKNHAIFSVGDALLLRSDIHVTDADAQAESGLTVADRRLLIGALEYKEKRQDVLPFPSSLSCNTPLPNLCVHVIIATADAALPCTSKWCVCSGSRMS